MHEQLKAIREKRKLKMNLISSLKIGLGSALAIFIAVLFQLPNPSSAGTITLLTLIAQTRRDTIKLTWQRLVTFVLTVFLCACIVPLVKEVYLGYALFLIVDVFITEMLDWKATLSVNAVIAAHFVINRDFSAAFIGHELIVLCIGIGIALALNLIQPDLSEKDELLERMERIEKELSDVLHEVSGMLSGGKENETRSKTLPLLRDELSDAIQAAARYSQNSFQESNQWLTAYFEMRLAQCVLLHELYGRCASYCQASEAGQKAAAYIRSLADYIDVPELPQKQLEENQALQKMIAGAYEKDGAFEANAMVLFAVLEMKEFVTLKYDFIESLSEPAKAGYRIAHQRRRIAKLNTSQDSKERQKTDGTI